MAIIIERIQWRLAAHDYELARFWTEVAEHIHALAPAAPVRATDVASLDELLDDPVMTEVVQGDEARRREVHATMVTAKRKLKRRNGEN